MLGTLAAYLVRSPTVLLAVLAVMGRFWAFVNVNSLPMVYDLAGQRSIGSYTGLYYFASSLATDHRPHPGRPADRLDELPSYLAVLPDLPGVGDRVHDAGAGAGEWRKT